MKRDMIVFGEDWGRHPSSTQHLIKQLAQHYRIIWINSIGLRQPTLSKNDIGRVIEKLKSLVKSKSKPIADQAGNEVSGSVIDSANNTHNVNDSPPPFPVISLLTIPAPKSGLARKLARQLMRFQLNKVLNAQGFTQPILWTSLPTAVDMIGTFDEKAVVYYCGDDFGGLAGVDHQTVIAREEALLTKVDIILAVSDKLVQRFPADKTVLLPHGVDFSLFAEPKPCHPLLAKPIQQGKKIAGFYGSLSEWLDIDLLKQTITHLDDWYFVFIGKPDVDISMLTDLANVYHYPPIAHNELAQCSQHWTVSILPFKDSKQIRACNPLKLREYLATGRPVVSTWYPALEPYKEHLFIANNADEFVSALQQATEPNQVKQGQVLQNLVADETWQARAETIHQLINQQLTNKT